MLFYRKNNLLVLALLTIVCFSSCQSGDDAQKSKDGPPLFTALAPEKTGITFQNTLEEGLNTNILMYEYFYNGGGVATGDFNGDGKLDLYFTANLSDNKLYVNKGNWQFEDVTDRAGAAGRPGPWKTGVTTVDINADGKLDIYLCYSGALPPEKRVNQLFVNQGNDASGVPQFTEQAAQYGLDSPGFSNQAYFLDYDRDGDLDMLLLNHNPKNLPILNEASTAELLKIDDPERGLRLFRQTSAGHFDDVTQQSGLNGSALSYGLGLGIADFNEDGWLDFYVSNDYAVPDYLYINQQNGRFSNELANSIGHTSQFSMGNDVADVNNDGRTDIFTLDMLPEDNRRQKLLMAPDNFAKFDLNVRSGFYYQYMRNMLHINEGIRKGQPSTSSTPLFAEIGQQAGVSNTDWSWAALLADFDNDGWKDLFVSNGYLRDYTNMDFIKYMDDFVKSRGRLQRQDVLEIIRNMPASNVVNYVFQNQKGQGFVKKTDAWGVNTPSNSNGTVYGDFDNDGDLDLIINNINQPAFVYRNELNTQIESHYLQCRLVGLGNNTQGIGANVTIYRKGKPQSQLQTITRGYLSSVSPILHFGLGNEMQVDSLVITWGSGKQQRLVSVKADQVLTLNEKDAQQVARPIPTVKPLLTEVASPIAYADPVISVNDFYRQSLLVNELSHTGPCMVKGDVNKDGLEDVFVGGAAGRAAMLFIQQKNGQFVARSSPAFEADKASHDAAAALFDANGDGALDIYVASGGYHEFAPDDPSLQDRLYVNDGKGNFQKSPNALPRMLVSKSCVAVQDVNQDGHPDLFVGGRVIPGRCPEIPESFLLINDGKGQFTNQTSTLAPELQKIGMVTDAVWVDMNKDKKLELVVVGEWMPITVFGNENGKLTNQTKAYLGETYTGWWNKIAVADFNNDQRPDLIVGNWGTNSQVKASDTEPTELYASDFDGNGSVEAILCTYIQGKSYPYVTRDELLNQINGFRPRYPSYDSYANVTLTDIFKSDDLSKALHLTANRLETTCFLSVKATRYAPVVLPDEVQYAPVHTITILDADRDGNQDLLLCGNNSRAKIRLGRMDANYGLLLRGDGTGHFSRMSQQASGLWLKGDVRSVLQLNNTLLFGINEGSVRAYKLPN